MRGRHGSIRWNDRGDRQGTGLDLYALLHPSRAFARPSDLIDDPDLTLNEKRAILASWASDACAAEAVRSLHRAPQDKPVDDIARFDDLMEALARLDAEACEQFGRDLPPVRKRPARSAKRRGSPDDGTGHRLS